MEPVESRRMKLKTLVVLQAAFAAMALAFLFTSGWYAYTTGAPLSAAPVVPSIVMFLIYSGFLAFPSFGKVGWYRVAMAIAIVPFGVGGVLLNILNYAQNGLRDFKSFEVWCIAASGSTASELFGML